MAKTETTASTWTVSRARPAAARIRATSADIGAVFLKRKNQGKGVERIEITLGAAPACG